MSLTEQQIDLVNFAEQYWHENGHFPPRKELAQELDLSLTGVERLLDDEVVTRALERRGIDENVHPYKLSGEQLAALHLVLDYDDHRPLSHKLKGIGVSTQQWNGWLKTKKFSVYYNERAEEILANAKGKVYNGLISAAERGEVPAIKLYLELTGRFNSKSSNEINLELQIQRLTESIYRNVKDPATLQRIAQEFIAISNSNSYTPPVAQAALAAVPVIPIIKE